MFYKGQGVVFFYSNDFLLLLLPSLGGHGKTYKASVKPVFAMRLTAPHANGNRGNETGWAGDWKTNRPKSTDYGCEGLSMDLLDGSLEAEIDSPDNLCCCTGLFGPFSHCCITLNNVDSTSARHL